MPTDTSDQQAVQSLLSGASGQQNQNNQLMQQMQSSLKYVLWISAAVSVVVTIYLIASAIHKWRVQSAILRMDKNLQALLALQTATIPAQKATKSSDENQGEQK
jgi:hypothetical protein